MYIYVRDVDLGSVSMSFRLDFGTATTVWYVFHFII